MKNTISLIRDYMVTEMASLLNYNWNDDFRIVKLNTVMESIQASLERNHGSPTVDITQLTQGEALELGFRPWDDSGLMLIPHYLWEFLRPGTEVTDIFGEKELITENYREEMDNDCRFGCLAFGIFPQPDQEKPHQQVEAFNQEILGIAKRDLGWMEENEFQLSLKQLREEIDEIEEAYQNQDLVGVIDGLIDLDYFHKGVIYKHGIQEPLYNDLFLAVHQANMEKKKGVKATRQGFGNAADAVKPEGWLPPEKRLQKILRQAHPELENQLEVEV